MRPRTLTRVVNAMAAAALSRGVASVVTVHNFSYGLLDPALGYPMSCVGSFLGLRCVTLDGGDDDAGLDVLQPAGMAALQIHRGAMPSMAAIAGSGGIASVSGTTAAVFLIPLLLVISIATFAVTLTISMAPGEEEIQADAEMRRRMEYLQHRRDWTQVPTGPAEPWYESLPDERF
jgi:hypothetical protein